LKSRILHVYGEETAITDAGVLLRRKYKTYRTRRKFEIKNISRLLEETAITDPAELSRRKHTTYRTRRNFEIKNTSRLWGGNCNNRPQGITQKKTYNKEV
jgi:hypothetical protein